MGRFRVYIKPFDEDGNYTAYREVTSDVVESSIGVISRALDNAEYSIGVYLNNNFTLKMNNIDGLYSDVDVQKSMFRYTRNDSLVKVTWEIATNDGPLCGETNAGDDDAILSEEIALYIGLLNDESFSFALDTHQATFKVLGRESLFKKATVPYSSINNGDLISDVLYALLNQEIITDLLTVSALNINPGNDVVIDDISDFENKDVKAIIDQLLLVSNSVLYVDSDDNIIIKDRTPTADLQYTFYGQASLIGIENIVNIQNIRNGVNRVFNYLTWQDNSTPVSDSSSITTFGRRAKEFNYGFITNATNQATLLNSILTEFADKKLEMEIDVPLNYDTYALDLLDRIAIDYPTVYYPGEYDLPICGIAICGQAVLPRGQWNFTMTTATNFKITGKKIDCKKELITFQLREI